MHGIRLIVMPGGGPGTDISYIVNTAKWGGRNGSATRTLSASVSDDDGQGHDRIDIDPERGDQCVMLYVDEQGVATELFRGLVMKIEQGSDKTLSFTAYDIGVYLANNRDTFCYEDKTASQIFVDVCGRFGIPTGEIAYTAHVVHELSKPKGTGWDAIGEALTQTYNATGIRYFPLAREGKMCLIERRKSIQQYLLDVTRNIISYSRSTSIEKIRTRIKAYDREDTVVGEAVDSALEAKIGIFQDIETADNEMSAAEITEMVQTSLHEVNKPEKRLEVECLGHPSIVTGTGVFVRIPHIGVQSPYYVEQDTHNYSDGNYTLDLSLSLAEDTQTAAPGEQAAQGSAFQQGQTVNFAGGPNYVSSDASKSAGTKQAVQGVTITHVAAGNAHPYHIEGTGICGWVDAGLLSAG